MTQGPAAETRKPEETPVGAYRADAPVRVNLSDDLLATDPRWEARLILLKQKPLALLRDARHAHLNPTAIEQMKRDVSLWPYRQDLLASLRADRNAGRRIILESDLPIALVQAVVDQLDIFDEVIADQPGANPNRPTLRDPDGSKSGLISALRPHQWLKNLLLLLPLILAHQVADRGKLVAGVTAFWSMSLCASAVYIVNDLLDVGSDRRHHSKKRRAFASGRASIPHGLVLAAIALASGLLASVWLPARFRLLLAGYLVLTTAYSFWLKRRMLIDVMVLASLYTLRIIAGAAAVGVPLTLWLLVFSMFFFLSLAFVKRYAELIRVEHDGGGELSGRGYRVSDLRIIETVGPTSGYLSVLVFCNYLDSQVVRGLYAIPQALWVVAPLLLYWITRIWFVARRQELDDDPVVYAIRDRVSQLTGLLTAAVVLVAWLGKPEWWPF